MILITGCFDIIHRGHIELFKYANVLAKRGEYSEPIFVLVDSDARVKLNKGVGRPINNQDDRRYVLSGMKGLQASRIMIFDTDEELVDVCGDFNPLRIVGSDYKGRTIIGGEHCRKIEYFERLENYSTTKTINELTKA